VVPPLPARQSDLVRAESDGVPFKARADPLRSLFASSMPSTRTTTAATHGRLDGVTVAAADALEAIQLVETAGIDVWVDGGWGVDALIGEESRPHNDLDLIVRIEDVSRMRDVLGTAGFQLTEGSPDSNFVLRDARGREIDVHPVRFDEDGNGIYRMADGRDWTYSAPGFNGSGLIGERSVRCLAADEQMLCHWVGYEPTETDFHDMRLLHSRLGTRLLHPFG
jgi:lincosamide nucleotidyltransferase A/C/D/E